MRRRRTRFLYSTVSIVVITAAAMSGRIENARAGGDGGANRVTMSGGDIAVDSTEKGPAVAWLTDPGIVALVDAMQAPVIAAGRLQLQSWMSDTTLNLALRLVREHAEYRAALDSFAYVVKLTPQRPAIADSMLAAYDYQLEALYGLGARDLERRYLTTQREAHERSLADLAAIGALARDPDLKALIVNRAMLMEQDHLARLQQSERRLAEADSIARERRTGRE